MNDKYKITSLNYQLATITIQLMLLFLLILLLLLDLNNEKIMGIIIIK
jgi:hypothetical protein